MVLESILNPTSAEKKPYILLFLGILYSSIAIILSLWVFESYASLVMVFLTVMACVPLIYNTIKLEEQKDLVLEKESSMLKEHSKALVFFLMLFIGTTLSFAIWYIFLPTSTGGNLFSVQIDTISTINNQVTGNFMYQLNVFTKIFLNNVKVMIFCILFAFVYGAGAIFILIWNASVIGVAIGNMSRVVLSGYATAVGLVKVGGYFHAYSIGLLRYAIHGVPEIFAYFIAGLAGGIISVALIRHDFGTRSFEKIIIDTSDLILLAILFLIVAGVLEVFVTPALF